MTRRICCLLMALLLMALVPAQATAVLLYSYPTVVVSFNSNQMVVLEHEFRQWVKELTHQYIKSHVGVAVHGGANATGDWQVYYEAATLKYRFDSQVGAILGPKYEDLPYNTNEEISERNYNQETREIMFYLITQNVQTKIFEINEMSEDERASLFPGKMLNPNTGEWEIDEIGLLAEAMDEAELLAKIEEGAAEATMLCAKSLFDVGMGLQGTHSDIPGIFTDLIKELWVSAIALNYEQTRAQLKNAYRQVMIDDLMAAQRNVDMQMYEGLYMLRGTLVAQKKLSTDEAILLECLNTVLGFVDDAMEQEQVLSRVYTTSEGQKTLDETIEELAEQAVTGLGMTEQELLDWQDVLVVETVLLMKETVKAVLGAMAESGSVPFGREQEAMIAGMLDAAFDGIVEQSKRESMDKDSNGEITLLEFLEFCQKYWNKEAFKMLGEYVGEMATFVQSETLYNQCFNRIITESRNKHQWGEAVTAQHRAHTSELKEEWRNVTRNKEAVLALIENGIELTMSVCELVPVVEKLWDSGREEVPVSKIASSMYRARQTSHEIRSMIVNEYEAFVNPFSAELSDESVWDKLIGTLEYLSTKTETDFWTAVDAEIDKAPIEELRELVNAMYTVVNTDLLGHSYYTTLCGWREYQQSPDEFFDNVLQAGEDYQAMFQAATEKGFWMTFGFLVFSPLYIDTFALVAVLESFDSEYLDYVAKHTERGSWYKLNDSIWVYNRMGDYAQQFQWDERFDPLFH